MNKIFFAEAGGTASVFVPELNCVISKCFCVLSVLDAFATKLIYLSFTCCTIASMQGLNTPLQGGQKPARGESPELSV